MKKISPTVSDLFSPVHEWEEHLRVNPILKFRVAEGHEKFQRVHKQIFFSRMNRRKKKSRTLLGEIFFTKKETIILTEYFFKFTGVFRVCNHGENLKNQKWLFYFTIEKTCKIKKWLFSSLSEVKFYFTVWSKIFPHWVKKKVKVALNRSSTENSGP